MQKTKDFAKICGVVHVVLNVFLILWLVIIAVFIWDGMSGQYPWAPVYFVFTIMRVLMGVDEGQPIIVNIVGEVLIFLSILYMRDLFKHLRQGESPFSERVLRVIKLLAGVAFINFIFDLSLPRLFFALAMLSLHVIFKHGLVLQDEADQTL
ncbi:MAG: hypothetical protein FWB98_03155 [Defluviitaleaceae bacterium]|nr:hypothetical protein [Defluviitaleaceae bacterium]